MAVKKVSSKSTHSLWKTTVVCNGKGAWHLQDKTNPCQQEIRATENDICKRGTPSYYGIICPFCKTFIEIESSKIPERVKNKAIRKF